MSATALRQALADEPEHRRRAMIVRMDESGATSPEITALRDRLTELQHRLCNGDMTMSEWQLGMEAYRVTELQLRRAMGFEATLPDAPAPSVGEAVH